uniref:Enhancer of rudimentary homolog n=1 Tax=Podarcis muralis TaxID=64176 RepID=A0A670HPA3_PODMU
AGTERRELTPPRGFEPSNAHTILLVQPTKQPEGRTYRLKRMNLKYTWSRDPSTTYDISQLFDFIDNLADLSSLVYRADTQTYQPYNKDWIKEKTYVFLRRQAQQASK